MQRDLTSPLNWAVLSVLTSSNIVEGMSTTAGKEPFVLEACAPLLLLLILLWLLIVAIGPAGGHIRGGGEPSALELDEDR